NFPTRGNLSDSEKAGVAWLNMAPGTDEKEQLSSSSWNHSVALFVNGGDQCAKCLNCTPRHPKGLPMQSKGRQERVLCLARSAAVLEEMRKALKAYSFDLLGAFTADQGVAIDRKSTRLNSSHLVISYA